MNQTIQGNQNAFNGLNRPQKQSWHLPSLFLLLGALFGVFTFLTSGLLSLAGGIYFVTKDGIDRAHWPFFALGWISLGLMALMIPAVVVAIKNLRQGGQAQVTPPGIALPVVLLLLIVPAILMVVGKYGYDVPALGLFLVPAIQIAIIGIFAWVVYRFARQGILAGTQLKRWAVHSFGILVVPTLAILIETLILVVIVVAVLIWAINQPGVAEQLTGLQDKIFEIIEDEEALKQLAQPVLNNWWVVFGVIMVVAGVMPVVEELIKPIAVWLLLRRGISEREGYLYGLISGLAFGVLESFSMMANPVKNSDEWLALVAARCVTVILHMTTTAITGRAIAMLPQKNGWPRLLGAYAAAIVIHAAWNKIGVLMGFNEFGSTLGTVNALGKAGPYLLGGLVIGMLVILYAFNRRYRREAA